jgi:collagenase-like PrtC family protease
VRRELSDRDTYQLNNAGSGIRLPMSNHYVEREEYVDNKPLLKKFHRPGNSIICTNDDLARWVREDFPDYRLDASVIKNVKSHEKIEQAMDLYDSVVLPMSANENLEFLEEIENKDKITLFANAGCALTCPSKTCYVSLSKINKGGGGKFQCSQNLKKREMHGMVDFPLEPYIKLGFHRFKLLRARPGAITGF